MENKKGRSPGYARIMRVPAIYQVALSDSRHLFARRQASHTAAQRSHWGKAKGEPVP